MTAEAALSANERWQKKGESKTGETTHETTPGRDREVHWKVVAMAQGPVDAAIIRGRLESEGIPARVQQEPAGAAIGLTVGLLGQVKVLVPEPLVARALQILNEPIEGDVAGEEPEAAP